MHATVFANEGDDDAGVMGEHLRECGFHLSVAHRERPDSWDDPTSGDLVVLLGSDWSVYWSEAARSVEAEADVVHVAHGRGTPVLGICFGAQMVAHAFGGRVERAPHPEIGWFEVDTDHPAIGTGPWFQWHADRFSPPPGFVNLAASAAGPQAMSNARTLAVQFHPEVTEGIVRRWTSDGGVAELERYGLTPDDLLADATIRFADSARRCRNLLDWFLSEFVGGPTT